MVTGSVDDEAERLDWTGVDHVTTMNQLVCLSPLFVVVDRVDAAGSALPAVICLPTGYCVAIISLTLWRVYKRFAAKHPWIH